MRMSLMNPKSDFELVDGVFHNAPEIVWQPGKFLPSHRKVADDYIHGRLGVQINMEASNVFSEPKLCKYALVFEKVAGNSFDPFEADRPVEGEVSCDLTRIGSKDGQPSVSISTGKFVDDAEQDGGLLDYQLSAFRSKARLHASDPGLQLIWQYRQILGAFIVVRRLNGDWEIDTVLVGNGIASYLSDCREGQGVEDCPELVKQLAELKCRVQADVRATSEPYQTCPIGLIFNAKVKRICFEESIPMLCKRVSMNFGTPETLPTFFENAGVCHE
jgi:hypothetical protein